MKSAFVSAFFLSALLLLMPPSARAVSACSDLLSAPLSPGGSSPTQAQQTVLELTGRLEKVFAPMARGRHIPTHQLPYIKALVLETTTLTNYLAELYRSTHPEETWLQDEMSARLDFLEAMNTHVSDTAKYRDMEKWLVAAQDQALKNSNRPDAQAYQILRDQLNLVYYPRLDLLHRQLAGMEVFFYEEPISWAAWLRDYVTFLKSLPGVPLEVEKSFLLEHLIREFRSLHDEVKVLQTADLESVPLEEVERRTHNLRRAIRMFSITVLKNSQWITLINVDHEWLDLDLNLVEAAMKSARHRSRYVSLHPPSIKEPIKFPSLSFYSIYYFTSELGVIKDQLEQVLFLQSILEPLKELKNREGPEPRYLGHTLHRTEQLLRAAHLQTESKTFIETIQQSHIFLYTASWLREINM